MKIFLDDVRPAPEGWTLCKTYDEALSLIKEATHISFDHDLGTELTGYDLAKVIEHEAYLGFQHRLEWGIHSANPVGRNNITLAMRNADYYWSRFGEDF